MFALAVQGIERDQAAGQAEFGEQRLGGRDLIRLLVDIAVRQHQGGIGGENAEQLCGGTIMEPVEAGHLQKPPRHDDCWLIH